MFCPTTISCKFTAAPEVLLHMALEFRPAPYLTLNRIGQKQIALVLTRIQIGSVRMKW